MKCLQCWGNLQINDQKDLLAYESFIAPSLITRSFDPSTPASDNSSVGKCPFEGRMREGFSSIQTNPTIPLLFTWERSQTTRA